MKRPMIDNMIDAIGEQGCLSATDAHSLIDCIKHLEGQIFIRNQIIQATINTLETIKTEDE